MAYVYILTNKNNSTLYIGVTNDLIRRICEHKNEFVDGFSRRYKLHKLIYYEQTDSMIQAIEREKQLKRWHRNWKINLINEKNPEWKDLYYEICS